MNGRKRRLSDTVGSVEEDQIPEGPRSRSIVNRAVESQGRSGEGESRSRKRVRTRFVNIGESENETENKDEDEKQKEQDQHTDSSRKMNGHTEMDVLLEGEESPSDPPTTSTNSANGAGTPSTFNSLLQSINRASGFDSEYMYQPTQTYNNRSNNGSQSKGRSSINPSAPSNSVSSKGKGKGKGKATEEISTIPRISDLLKHGGGAKRGNRNDIDTLDSDEEEDGMGKTSVGGNGEGEGLRKVKREEFVRVVLQALRDVGYE